MNSQQQKLNTITSMSRCSTFAPFLTLQNKVSSLPFSNSKTKVREEKTLIFSSILIAMFPTSNITI